MSETLKHEIAAITLWHMGGIIIVLAAMTILYMKANKSESLKAFIKVAGGILIWMVGKNLKTVAFDIDLRWASIVLYYGGISYLGVAFLEFGYAYYSGKRLPRKVLIGAYFIALYQFLTVLTNPLHHLFYATYDFKGDSFGPLFYVHILIEYSFIIAGSIYCGIRFKKQLSHVPKTFKFLVGLAILSPIVLNLIYVSKLLKKVFRFLHIQFSFDITPLVFAWSLLLFIYVTFKYEFFELSPIMRHEIMKKLPTPLCILDRSQRLVYQNIALMEVYEAPLYQSVKTLIGKGERSPEDLTDVFEHTTWVGGKCYKIFVRKVWANKVVSYVATFNDITSYRQLEEALVTKREELDEANKQLEVTIQVLKESSKSGARSYVARELHDIMGHSLVVTIKLLEVASIYRSKDREMSDQALAEAITSIETGIAEMHTVCHQGHGKDNYNGHALEKELSRLLAHIGSTGIETRIQFKGALYQLEALVFDVVKKVCTELVTNTLKHSNGTHLLLSVNIQEDGMRIHVVDDGSGCGHLICGNGLLGIINRLDSIGGQVKFTTEAEQGFGAYIHIPLNK